MDQSHPHPIIDPSLLNTSGGDSRWTNLGFWRETRSYPAAAEALARRTGEAAKMKEGDVVLDCACGYGDSLALWVREFGAQRVIGLEADPIVASVAAKRVSQWGLADRITVRCATAESVIPERDASGVTAVVSVDAAYQFQTRFAWLTRLGRGVAPGTRLGLADLVVTHRALRRRLVGALARRVAIPEENLWCAEDVEPVLADAGFMLDRLVRCGGEVLTGFAWHALRNAPRWARRPGAGGWRALWTAVAIAEARRRRHLDYVVVQGRAVPGGR